MKIYTKTGDDGQTGLFGGARVSKASDRVEAYGTIDELNSVLGLVRAQALSVDLDAALATIQNELFDLGAELATVAEKVDKLKVAKIADDCVLRLEGWIDAAETELTPLTNFILPGGTAAAANLHFARSVCRRAERCIIASEQTAPVRPILVHYVNRLSDLLFVWARLANARGGVADVAWQARA